MNDEHIHTGFVAFVTVGVYAVIFLWLMRIIAARLVNYPPTETIGKALGALIHSGS
jgi:hypothetical protein